MEVFKKWPSALIVFVLTLLFQSMSAFSQEKSCSELPELFSKESTRKLMEQDPFFEWSLTGGANAKTLAQQKRDYLRDMTETALGGKLDPYRFDAVAGAYLSLNGDRFKVEMLERAEFSDEQIRALMKGVIGDEIKTKVHIDTRLFLASSTRIRNEGDYIISISQDIEGLDIEFVMEGEYSLVLSFSGNPELIRKYKEKLFRKIRKLQSPD